MNFMIRLLLVEIAAPYQYANGISDIRWCHCGNWLQN